MESTTTSDAESLNYRSTKMVVSTQRLWLILDLKGLRILPAKFERMGFRAIVDESEVCSDKAKAGDSLTETPRCVAPNRRVSLVSWRSASY